jgi:hypothetical protein
MKQILILVSLLASLLLSACGAGSSSQDAMSVASPSSAPGAPAAEAPALAGGSAYDRDASAEESAQQPQIERMVIKNGSLYIRVDDISQAEQQISLLAQQKGGYIVSTSTYGGGEARGSTIVFRVPAAQFEATMSDVEGIAKEVTERSVSGEDVTEEFVDLGSRLKNLEATRERLLDLLAKANRVEDALSVNQALTDVQGEIEVIQGRMKYLQQSAALSTITANISKVVTTPIIPEDAWQPLEVARGALNGLIAFGQALVNLAIVLLIWTPLWLPILLLARWGFRKLIGKDRKKPTPPSSPSKLDPIDQA